MLIEISCQKLIVSNVISAFLYDLKPKIVFGGHPWWPTQSAPFSKILGSAPGEVAFYQLNIYNVNFTNYHHMVESNFKGINLRKLCEKAILIKCILTLDNSNTHQLNTIETVIRTFDLPNSSNYRNSLAVSTIIVLWTIMITQSPSSGVNSSSFLLVRDHLHIAST